MESIDKAIASRAQIPGLLTKMAQDVVSREELMSIMGDLMKRIDALETPAPVVEVEVKEPAAEVKTASAAARKAAEKAAEKAAKAAEAEAK